MRMAAPDREDAREILADVAADLDLEGVKPVFTIACREHPAASAGQIGIVISVTRESSAPPKKWNSATPRLRVRASSTAVSIRRVPIRTPPGAPEARRDPPPFPRVPTEKPAGLLLQRRAGGGLVFHRDRRQDGNLPQPLAPPSSTTRSARLRNLRRSDEAKVKGAASGASKDSISTCRIRSSRFMVSWRPVPDPNSPDGGARYARRRVGAHGIPTRGGTVSWCTGLDQCSEMSVIGQLPRRRRLQAGVGPFTPRHANASAGIFSFHIDIHQRCTGKNKGGHHERERRFPGMYVRRPFPRYYRGRCEADQSSAARSKSQRPRNTPHQSHGPRCRAMLDSYATAIKALLELPGSDPQLLPNALIHTLDCPHGNGGYDLAVMWLVADRRLQLSPQSPKFRFRMGLDGAAFADRPFGRAC